MQDLVDELRRALTTYLDATYRHALTHAAVSSDPRAIIDTLLPLTVLVVADEHSRLARRIQDHDDLATLVHELHTSGDQLAARAGSLRADRGL